ncbi:SusC/RagA family TonB-linked outer membrane protein [Parabacteroides sp. 52]|uniref:SusC/RagA family TonB-linked outer membrane protein n=1 Tax=unclassified Parabacteroides TaxID=2649774 RepID=UPI0013D08629|nr:MULTISPECIES: SusC/RagA family TonB-linked outer membrane protein [unclassified Parabacteroides]MDH6533912.1 TonB-linked SusC/RagA family outer membrane protein [Parabacteroides sp. PM5-20]NDV54657.1 SusC/RagA family TonB-linked outer membrane protein [Parabacteroides sp. 52]
MMKRLTYFLFCLVMSIGIAQAQTTKITGNVISAEDNEPIIGASIMIKGTSTGTVTDFEGNFTLEVPSATKTVQVSFVGMETMEVAVKPRMNIVMNVSSLALGEVMVVAYGTATKRSFTGSAAKVEGEKIAQKNTSEISKALQGEVAGVQVFNTSGQPGSNAVIRIRGIGSVNSSNAPIYVVDGIPYEANISGINPSDIESMTVLKDATATALYGSRAANGVILITTKKGQKGKTKVEAEVKYGISQRWIPLYDKVEDPERYMELTWEGLKNRGQYINGLEESAARQWASGEIWGGKLGINNAYNMWNATGTDFIDPTTGRVKDGVQRKFTPEKWEDHIFRTGEKVEGDVRISGGSDKLTYFTSLGYYKEKGYYMGSDFERFNARSNLVNDVTSWLKTTMNMGYTNIKSSNPGQTDNMNNGFQYVNFMAPIFPVFERDENGALIPDEVVGGYRYDYGEKGRPYGAAVNPVGVINLDDKTTETNLFNGNYLAEARFLKDFKLSSNLGVQFSSMRYNNLTNPYYGDAKSAYGRIAKEQQTQKRITFNQVLSYTKEIGDHNIDVFVAHETDRYKLSWISGEKSLLVRAGVTEWTNAVIMQSMDSETWEYAIESYFGQIRYDYQDKYHFNASLRRDGSSRFSKGNKWGTFGSIGAAWVINKESFLSDVSWLKNLKYKLSWGKLGNQFLNTGYSRANYYPYEDLYSISNMNDKPSFTFQYKGNQNLTWEKSSTINTGIEFNIFDRLEGEVEVYRSSTTDMLFMKQVAPSLGYAQYPVNDGEMVNTGIEFNLTGHIINTNDFKFDIRLNGGHYKNKMGKMPLDDTTGERKPIEVRSSSSAWAKGHSIREYYIKEYAGVNPETGLAEYNQYVNVKADGTEEIITEMETYLHRNKGNIGTIKVNKTSNYSLATQKFIDKTSIPTISGGFGLDLDYKGLTFSSTFTYALGGYAYDNVYATLMNSGAAGNYNWHSDIEKRWTQPGDITDVPRLSAGGDTYATALSTRFLTKRSYLNLANIRIGYTFPKSVLNHIKVAGLSVYVTGDNLFTVSARKGFVAMASETGSSDRSHYLPVSSVTGGIKIDF